MRQAYRLLSSSIKTAPEGLHPDGDSLYLRVKKSGARSWVYRYRCPTTQRLRDMGLGAWPRIGLAEARKLRDQWKSVRAEGLDPLQEREGKRTEAKIESNEKIIKPFSECATLYIESHKSGWSNAKHINQWTRTLEDAAKAMKDPDIKTLDVEDVLKAIKPIWASKTETAKRTMNRIAKVIDWATVMKYRTGDNPARWQGNLDALLPALNKVRKVEHHAALPYQEVPTLVSKLQSSTTTASKALLLLLLTGTRTKEVIGATRDEFDLDTKVWTIPAERMKARKEHRIPLCETVVALVREIQQHPRSQYLFTGSRHNRHISDMTMLKCLKDEMGYPCTVHGLRSTFRDWGAETTDFDRTTMEHALAHKLPDKVEAAYQRGDLLAKRQALMNAWEAYCLGKPASR